MSAMSFSSLEATESASDFSIASVAQTERPLGGFITFGLVSAIIDGYTDTGGATGNRMFYRVELKQ